LGNNRNSLCLVFHARIKRAKQISDLTALNQKLNKEIKTFLKQEKIKLKSKEKEQLWQKEVSKRTLRLLKKCLDQSSNRFKH